MIVCPFPQEFVWNQSRQFCFTPPMEHNPLERCPSEKLESMRSKRSFEGILESNNDVPDNIHKKSKMLPVIEHRYKGSISLQNNSDERPNIEREIMLYSQIQGSLVSIPQYQDSWIRHHSAYLSRNGLNGGSV